MAIGRFVSSVYTPGVRYIYTTGKTFSRLTLNVIAVRTVH